MEGGTRQHVTKEAWGRIRGKICTQTATEASGPPVLTAEFLCTATVFFWHSGPNHFQPNGTYTPPSGLCWRLADRSQPMTSTTTSTTVSCEAWLMQQARKTWKNCLFVQLCTFGACNWMAVVWNISFSPAALFVLLDIWFILLSHQVRFQL